MTALIACSGGGAVEQQSPPADSQPGSQSSPPADPQQPEQPSSPADIPPSTLAAIPPSTPAATPPSTPPATPPSTPPATPPSTPPATPADVQYGPGEWSPVQPWPSATHVHLAPTGEVVFWGEYDAGLSVNFWDPQSNKLRSIAAPYNLFCAGHTLMADGSLFITGGHVASHVGFINASILDPVAATFTKVADMNAPRWYPTVTALANGDMLVTSGEMHGSGDIDQLPQVWEVANSRWRDLTGAVLMLPYYPRLLVAPNGMVFAAGPMQASQYLDTEGAGRWIPVGPSALKDRAYGSAVLYDTGKIFIAGGGDPPTNTAEVIDLTASTPAWRATAPMSSARRQHNAVALPDGKVLVTGGSSGPGFNNRATPVLTTEIWDPLTEKWTEGAKASVYRGYHSTSLLLPDGRILNAGGRTAIDYTMQIYSPGYLTAGPRPTITTAPATIAPGSQFEIATPDAAQVNQVTLVRNGSVTHSFNMNTRFVRLAFSAGTGTLTVTAPANNALAPPGHYLLFLVSQAGAPSIGKIVQVQLSGATTPTAPTAGPSPTGPTGTGPAATP